MLSGSVILLKIFAKYLEEIVVDRFLMDNSPSNIFQKYLFLWERYQQNSWTFFGGHEHDWLKDVRLTDSDCRTKNILITELSKLVCTL